jgi:hypothetical protein
MYTSVNFLNFLNDCKLARKVEAVPLHVKQALSGGIPDLGAGRECVVSAKPRPFNSIERDPVAGWAIGPVWTCPENLASTWGRTPYRSEPLYVLRHPVHQISAKTEC